MIQKLLEYQNVPDLGEIIHMSRTGASLYRRAETPCVCRGLQIRISSPPLPVHGDWRCHRIYSVLHAVVALELAHWEKEEDPKLSDFIQYTLVSSIHIISSQFCA